MEPWLYQRKVHYYETDQMAIVHHSNYIRWFEEARIEYLDHLGTGYAQMERSGIVIPVVSVSCEYKSMVHFGETVQIAIEILSYDGIRMTLSYRVSDAQSGKLRCTGTSSHCFLSSSGKICSMKKVRPEIHSIWSTAYENCLRNREEGKQS